MNNVVRAILAVLIILVCVGLFIFTYLLNKRTPKPEGCKDVGEGCEGCKITSCAHYKEKHKNDEEKKEG